jgi:hypothetical protein
MLSFNLDISIVQALIENSSGAGVVECATAWLSAYEAAQQHGADAGAALAQAAEAWDRAARQWRTRLKPEQASTA